MRCCAAMALSVLACAMAGPMAPPPVHGDDFRIANKVFVGEAEAPSSETVTIFHDGVVYDWAAEPREVVVFDPVRGRFVLLDPVREVRTEIALEQIESLFVTMQEKMRQRSDDYTAFILDPQYQGPSRDDPWDVVFRGRFMTYRAQARPARTDTAAAQFARFTDAYTRLGSLKRPPLLARIPLNDWLAAQKRLPEEIELTIYQKGVLGVMSEAAKYRSRHVVNWILSRDDLRKVEQVGRWLAEYRQVGPLEYWDEGN